MLLLRNHHGSLNLCSCVRVGEHLLASCALPVCFGTCFLTGSVIFFEFGEIVTERRDSQRGRIGNLCGTCTVRKILMAVLAGIVSFFTCFHTRRFNFCVSCHNVCFLLNNLGSRDLCHAVRVGEQLFTSGTLPVCFRTGCGTG